MQEESPKPVITTEQIIAKIKETCPQDMGSYMCINENIIIFYSEVENQIIIMNNDVIIDDYQISSSKHVCSTGSCEEEFNKIIKENLFS